MFVVQRQRVDLRLVMWSVSEALYHQ